MKPGKVFLDTGIYFAPLNKRDRHHIQAVALFGGPKPDWYTSILDWSEAHSWFLHRQGENTARMFRTLASSLEGLEILSADLSLHDETLQMLDRMRGARPACVDASSLDLSRREVDDGGKFDHGERFSAGLTLGLSRLRRGNGT